MRFPQHILDDIRARLPLSDVVGRKVTWDARKSQPRKGDMWACCPFHAEKNPSFHVDDHKGFYHCFGCGASGDHFRFLIATEGLGFAEAVERLAEEAGVALPAPTPEAARAERQRMALIDVVEAACRFFEDEFNGPAGAAARAYVEGRGLTPATAATFRFGLALDRRDALKQHLARRGVDERQMVEAGLLVKPDDGRPSYDRFRNRLIIPIEDLRGRVIAFGGRTLDPAGEPKYLNSPETPLFHKSEVLFNAHRARAAARDAGRETGRVVVVEGYLDVIALHQAGIETVVAALGTAFTEAHLTLLWRLADEPLMCFDGDQAGRTAAYRAIDRILPLLAPGRSANFVFLPEGRDPDDIVRSGGRAAFAAAAADRVTLVDALWAREAAGAAIDTPERRAAFEARLNAIVATIADPMVRRRYEDDLRARLRELFFAQTRRHFGEARPRHDQARSLFVEDRSRHGRPRFAGASAPRSATGAGAGAALPTPATDPLGLERIVLGLGLEYPRLAERYAERLSAVPWSSRAHGRFAATVLSAFDAAPVADFESLAARLPAGYEILLAELHGGPGPPRAVRLKQRFGILDLAPPEDFVERCFMQFLGRLELAALETELADLVAPRPIPVGPQEEARVLNLLREVGARKRAFEENERSLADEASALRKAAAKPVGNA